ncbi:SIMPL domain-containing protein [Bacillus carboniphilus]|uniref:SIMPL domain-containing protein n=1 Tax=Bacillus carboniphilus TaxID=86663 RepID=A0ABP3FZ99_9BACI
MYYQTPYFQYAHRNQTNGKNNKVEVLGEGKVSASPDIAIIRLGVITDGKELTNVLSENSDAMNNVITSLKGQGIPDENIKTDEYRIDIQYDYIDGKQVFRGYRVTNMIEVTIDNVNMSGVVVDTAVKNGANTVSNIEFAIENPANYYNQALELAVENAHSKASTIAKATGVTLQPVPFSISEVTTPQERPVMYETTAMVKGVSTPPIQAGELEITAKIIAKYSFS